jgi:hypothetical protein
MIPESAALIRRYVISGNVPVWPGAVPDWPNHNEKWVELAAGRQLDTISRRYLVFS